MSERMANVDIEDVLSSIRRLVTEDGQCARGMSRSMLKLAGATLLGS